MANWIQTFHGRKVDPLNIKVEDIEIGDIAHALSLKCRFSGMILEHYSVAQHSVTVSQYCTNYKLWGLLHDAAEAYMFDASKPFKDGFRARFGGMLDVVEREIMNSVCAKFNLSLEEPHEVKIVDTLLLATEGKAFFGGTDTYEDWEVRPENGYLIIKPYATVCWTPEQAENAFLEAFFELTDQGYRK